MRGVLIVGLGLLIVIMSGVSLNVNAQGFGPGIGGSGSGGSPDPDPDTILAAPVTADMPIALTAGYVKVDASAGTVNLTLPAVATAASPCLLTFICVEPVGVYSINLLGSGAELIVDNNLYDLMHDKGDVVRLISDGTQWWIR